MSTTNGTPVLPPPPPQTPPLAGGLSTGGLHAAGLDAVRSLLLKGDPQQLEEALARAQAAASVPASDRAAQRAEIISLAQAEGPPPEGTDDIILGVLRSLNGVVNGATLFSHGLCRVVWGRACAGELLRFGRSRGAGGLAGDGLGGGSTHWPASQLAVLGCSCCSRRSSARLSPCLTRSPAAAPILP